MNHYKVDMSHPEVDMSHPEVDMSHHKLFGYYNLNSAIFTDWE